MSLTTNNTSLQEILAAVNGLPEAGGGGTSIETCTVTIGAAYSLEYGVSVYFIYPTVENGAIKTKQVVIAAESKQFVTQDISVVKNSTIMVGTNEYSSTDIATGTPVFSTHDESAHAILITSDGEEVMVRT